MVHCLKFIFTLKEKPTDPLNEILKCDHIIIDVFIFEEKKKVQIIENFSL